MKIQFMSQIPGNYKEKQKAHLHFLPFYLEKFGNKIDVIDRKSWPRFYFRYLAFNPDILVVSGLIGFIPMLFKKVGLIRKPVVYYWGDYFHEVMGKKWGIDRCAYLEFFCAKNATFVSTPSRFLENLCDTAGIKNYKYIPHGITDDFEKIPASSLPELSSEQKKLVKFIYIGDIDVYKKADRIINAVKNQRCILYLIGKVSEKNIIRSLPKNIIYLEEMPHDKVIGYLKACDIAVVTSDQDSALKMFEYIALKKPILGFRGRMSYILSNRENAILVSDFSPAVRELIQDPKLRETLKKNISQIKVRSWQSIAGEYERIFQSLKK